MLYDSKRFLSKEQIVFAIEGVVSTIGVAPKKAEFKGTWGKAEYKKYMRHVIKSSAAQVGWEMATGLEGLYVVVTILLPPGAGYWNVNKATTKMAYDNEVTAVRQPSVDAFLKNLLSCMEGIIFERKPQVVATLVVKEFSENPRVEVLVGKADNLKEVLNDLRNA